jgi:hypothetical protein
VQWRVAVLDLATPRAHTLAETRDVDDQVEGLDDDVVYLRCKHAAPTSVHRA